MKNTASSTVFSIYLLYPTNRDDEGSFYKLLQNYSSIGIGLQAYLLDWEKMDGLPKSYLYVPSDHELFIHKAYKDGLLTKEEISFINCRIISECNLLILFGNVSTNKAITELSYAKENVIPIYTMPNLSPMAIDALKLAIKLIIRAEED